MLSISQPLTGGQSQYYANLAVEDYYLEGGEPPGQWYGLGADALNLSGKIDNAEFLEVFSGTLRGKKLVQNAKLDSRVPGWDLTLSAPKSVSVAWSQADTLTSLEIRAAHKEAVEKALSYIQREAGFSRTGKFGQNVERAGLIFATFEHGTSRAQDPQLHTHCLLMNASVRGNGSTGAVFMQPIYKLKMAGGAIYRAELAHQLRGRLGFDLEQDSKAKFSFRLKGVSRELEEHFSKRRREVEEHLNKRGLKGALASAKMAVLSRGNKQHAPRQQLLEEWRDIGREHGFSNRELIGLIREERRLERQDSEFVANLLAYEAVEEITRHHSTFTRTDLVRKTAELAQTEGLSTEILLEAVTDTLQAREVVNLGRALEKAAIHNHPELHELRFTTKEILELERKMLSQITAGRGNHHALVDQEIVDAMIDARPTIKEEQAAAVIHLTTCPDQVRTVTGKPGTGKTYMLAAAAEAWKMSGYEVRGLAPSAKAARGLEEGANISSSTIHSWLLALKNRYETISKNSIIVMDEAGMTDTRIMAAVIKKVHRAGATLALIGDPGQLQAVELGGAFKALSETLGHNIELNEIVRQEKEADRQAVRDVSEGRTLAALRHFQKSGQLTVCEDGEMARDALLVDWLETGLSNPQDQLIFCGTNLDAVILNRQIQAERIRTGALFAHRFVETEGEKFYEGDRVIFRKNARARGIDNGMLGTVTAVNPVLNSMAVKVDGIEQTKIISLAEYNQVKISYAVTTHCGQGMTVKRAFVLTSETMQDRELTTVQVSRAKLQTSVYTTEMEAGTELSALARRMERSRQKELAIVQNNNPGNTDLDLSRRR